MSCIFSNAALCVKLRQVVDFHLFQVASSDNSGPLSPSHHGRKLSSPRLPLLFDKCTGIGYFFGREQVSVSNNWDTMLLFKWRSGYFTHTQFTQSQDTSRPSHPIPGRFTPNCRTPTPRLGILWILLETLSPVSTPSPMMLRDKWIFQKLETKLLSQQLKCIFVLIFFEHCRDLFCTLSHSFDPK